MHSQGSFFTTHALAKISMHRLEVLNHRMHAGFEDLLSPNDTINNLANGKQWNWGESPGPNSTKWDKYIFIGFQNFCTTETCWPVWGLGNIHHKYHNKIKWQESHDMISKTTKLWNSLWVILITPVIYELHWLPLEFRIQYKLAVLAFRHFKGTLPTYLSAMLCTYEPARSLRSSTERLLKSPRVNLKSAGERSFHFAAPAVWNSFQTASVTASSVQKATLSSFSGWCNLFVFIVCALWVLLIKNPPLLLLLLVHLFIWCLWFSDQVSLKTQQKSYYSHYFGQLAVWNLGRPMLN